MTDSLDADLMVGPCILIATKTAGVQLIVGDYTRTLTPAEASAFATMIEQAAANALATAVLINSQPDGLARMGGNLFARA